MSRKHGRFFLILFFLLIRIAAAYSFPETVRLGSKIDNNSETKVSNDMLWLRTPLYILTNQYLSVAAHEGAHALSAKLMGYEIETFKIGLLKGEVLVKDSGDMNPLQSEFFFLSGPLANRFLATGVNSYLDINENNINENARAFLGTTYIWNRGNFAWYLFRSFFAAVFTGDFISDWGNAAYVCSGKNIEGAYFILGSFTALEIWDLYNSRDEIVKNWDRMLGKYPAAVAAPSGLQIMPYGKGFIISNPISF